MTWIGAIKILRIFYKNNFILFKKLCCELHSFLLFIKNSKKKKNPKNITRKQLLFSRTAGEQHFTQWRRKNKIVGREKNRNDLWGQFHCHRWRGGKRRF